MTWVKVIDENNKMLFHKRNTDWRVTINKIDVEFRKEVTKKSYRKEIKDWEVEIIDSTNQKVGAFIARTFYFNTKQQALKYAKSYMRKH